jgi:7-cyano-7-deazaguanine reductase
MENIANRVLDDVVKAVKPRSCTVVGDFTPRGGLSSIVTATYKAKR